MNPKYVLITPAHNEELHIENVIQSIVSQTIRPEKWIIMNDGSEDATGDIARDYQKRYDFIVYQRLLRGRSSSYYRRRTEVFLAGFNLIRQTDYEFIGGLDADITLEPTYYESILAEFRKNPNLGIASGVYFDSVDGGLRRVLRAPQSTPGALQLFRRECYKQIGGYVPLKYGGDDSLADIMARMKGWDTRSFKKYRVVHHRPVGTGQNRTILVGKFRQGLAEYQLGSIPSFMLAKSIYRLFWEYPYFFASVARLTGYLYACARREQREVPPDVVDFSRREQRSRLKRCLPFLGKTAT